MTLTTIRNYTTSRDLTPMPQKRYRPEGIWPLLGVGSVSMTYKATRSTPRAGFLRQSPA